MSNEQTLEFYISKYKIRLKTSSVEDTQWLIKSLNDDLNDLAVKFPTVDFAQLAIYECIKVLGDNFKLEDDVKRLSAELEQLNQSLQRLVSDIDC